MIILNSRRSKGSPPWIDWRAALADHRDIRNPSRSMWTAYGFAGAGRLDSEYVQSARRSEYLVYSYRTPIAWVDGDGEWIIPDEHYSTTTTQHQNLIRTAVGSHDPSADADLDPLGMARVRQASAEVERVLAYPEFDAVGLPVTVGPYWR